MGYSMEFESMLTESQSVVLTADTNYTIKLGGDEWIRTTAHYRMKVPIYQTELHHHNKGLRDLDSNQGLQRLMRPCR